MIFTDSTGSLNSTGDSTMRLPADSMSLMVAKAPSGKASAGHGTSRSCSRVSSTPNGNLCLATTIVLVETGFLFGFEAAHAPLRLAVQPCLRDEHREQSEDHCKGDHHDCGFTHDDLPEIPRRIFFAPLYRG